MSWVFVYLKEEAYMTASLRMGLLVFVVSAIRNTRALYVAEPLP